MTLIDNLEEDFLETLIEHNGFTKEEALNFWAENNEEYLSKIFQCMSDEIISLLKENKC